MKEESLLLLSDLQKLINQVVLIDYIIIILGEYIMLLSKETIYTIKGIYDLPEGHLMQGVNGLYGDSQSEKRSLFQARSSKEKGNCNRL